LRCLGAKYSSKVRQQLAGAQSRNISHQVGSRSEGGASYG